jgi:hypothetical protein
MRKARGLIGLGSCAVVALLLGLAPLAHADFTSTLGSGNSAISGFAGPYATVDVALVNSTTATITFTSNTVNGNIYLMGDDGQGAVAVNVSASAFSVSGITGSNSGTGFTVGPLTLNSGSTSMDGFGSFNLGIDDFDGFTHSADTISFTVTNTSGTWASAADVLTANANGNDAAAHIFVTSSPANASNTALATGFAGESAAVVPEPSSLILFGFGVLALGFAVRRQLLPAIDDSDDRLAA